LITTYTREGDLVLDPFCGSGTTVIAALKHGRRAVGIDNDEVAIRETQARIAELLGGAGQEGCPSPRME
jgi:site-specific DNA-methyltransferase (adenine-specific)